MKGYEIVSEAIRPRTKRALIGAGIGGGVAGGYAALTYDARLARLKKQRDSTILPWKKAKLDQKIASIEKMGRARYTALHAGVGGGLGAMIGGAKS